ncbi:STM4015 family protein [Cerasicoccus arenae]|uniref:WGR domain-containing protein n=1 Tax=Cerasicoccus arenae TaxID=424488 RepID=A0A8J3GEG9_9BACT|nr:STM4015 family protein [Cerasicoccus arenae]MBK1859699.1 STM4015 family protein [Cerasicoccus arenae]GHC03747.1 WGR domain-containing protein [Cerasicoccus arenae]
MKSELVYMDSKSSKFWNLTSEGAKHTVVYGRIGTDGQTKEKVFKSEEDAKKNFEKLVKQKMSKGYIEASTGTTSTPEGTENGLIPAIAFNSIKKQSDLHENAGTFVGKRIVDFDPKKGAKADSSLAYRFRIDWDSDDSVTDMLKQYLDSDACLHATALVIGAWSGDDSEASPEPIIKLLTERKDRLPKITAIYLGDIIAEENEMSWINQSDITPLLSAFPNLQLLRTRGGDSLQLEPVKHETLRALAIETGGLDADVIRAILSCDFPALEHLEIWLGTDEYGSNSSVEDLQPLFAGELFPNLKYLGLRNCDYVDNIAGVIVNSPIIDRIETLDLSLGVLTDTGGNALLNAPNGKALKRLDLHYNYMTAGMIKKLKSLDLTVDASKPSDMDEDGEWRFVAVGE